jgi:hypothetical protein
VRDGAVLGTQRAIKGGLAQLGEVLHTHPLAPVVHQVLHLGQPRVGTFAHLGGVDEGERAVGRVEEPNDRLRVYRVLAGRLVDDGC